MGFSEDDRVRSKNLAHQHAVAFLKSLYNRGQSRVEVLSTIAHNHGKIRTDILEEATRLAKGLSREQIERL